MPGLRAGDGDKPLAPGLKAGLPAGQWEPEVMEIDEGEDKEEDTESNDGHEARADPMPNWRIPPCGGTPTRTIALVSGAVVPTCSGGVTTGYAMTAARVTGTISSDRPSPTCFAMGGTTSATDGYNCATAMTFGGCSTTITSAPCVLVVGRSSADGTPVTGGT
jgi:hypothetical protein